MNNPIKSKVARVLNSREIAIAAGSKKGVQVGMRFDVLDPKGEDIRDPETDIALGSLSRPKVRVKVTEVQERLSVASTLEKGQVNIGGTNPNMEAIKAVGLFSRALMPPKYVTQYETLKAKEKHWEEFDESESYVKTGDPVVQVLEESVAENETDSVSQQGS